jgi:hypothetical protein
MDRMESKIISYENNKRNSPPLSGGTIYGNQQIDIVKCPLSSWAMAYENKSMAWMILMMRREWE